MKNKKHITDFLWDPAGKPIWFPLLDQVKWWWIVLPVNCREDLTLFNWAWLELPYWEQEIIYSIHKPQRHPTPGNGVKSKVRTALKPTLAEKTVSLEGEVDDAKLQYRFRALLAAGLPTRSEWKIILDYLVTKKTSVDFIILVPGMVNIRQSKEYTGNLKNITGGYLK